MEIHRLFTKALIRRLSMDKKYTIAIIAVIIAVLAIGGYFAFSNFTVPESSPSTDLFDFSSQPSTSWNAEKKEYSFSQTIASVNGKDYKNIDIKVNFYKDNNLMDSYNTKIDSTKNGKFNLKFKKKLSEEPDAFYYDVVSATEV